MESCKPFDVLDLGKHERLHWQRTTFGRGRTSPASEQVLHRYRARVLNLYGARPMTDMVHLHGRRGRAAVHVGAVDALVTIDEIEAAVDECIKLKQQELQVLGWEWDADLRELVGADAKNLGVEVTLLQIPREVMQRRATAGADVRFCQLPNLEVAVGKPKKLTAEVTLKDFVIPNPELMPDDARARIGKWSDYIDYWAVDWDFRNHTFMQGWVAYRTRGHRALRLRSNRYTYENPGNYRIQVKGGRHLRQRLLPGS